MGGEVTRKDMENLANTKVYTFTDRPCIPGKTVIFGPCAGTDHGQAQQVPRSPDSRYKETTLRQTSAVIGGVSLSDELARLLNRYSEENASNTPDFILAKFLVNALDTFNIAVQEREKWYGRKVW